MLSGLSSFVGVLFVVAGCAPSLSPGAPCDLSSDCSAPLVCRNARCRIACVEARDCGPGLRCVQSNEGPSCTLEREESCDAANPCPGALRCVFGQCRSECITDADCSRDGVCDVDGSCLEPQSGTDASVMRMDAGVSDAPSCTPSTLVCADDALQSCDVVAPGALRAITGTDGGELQRVSHTIADIERPREGPDALPPEVALGLSGDGYGILGYLAGGVERRAEFRRFALGEPAANAPVATDTPITAGRTVGLGEHGTQVVGFVLVTDPPDPGGLAGMNVVFTSAGDGVTRPISAFDPVGIASGEMTTIGGNRSVGPSSSPLHYIARENKLHMAETMLTPSVGAIDEGISASGYRASVTSSLSAAHDYLTMGGSSGTVVILHEPGSVRYGLWNVLETLPLASPDTIPPDDLLVSADFDAPIGGPAIVQVGTDGSYVVAVPTTNGDGAGVIRLFTVRCLDEARCETPVALEDLPTRTGRRPDVVRLAPLRSGYALASIEPDATGDAAAYLYLFDPNWDDVSADVAPIVPVPTLTTETVAAIQIGSASDGASASVFVAVLVRDETRTRDRIWLGGYHACLMP